MDNHFELFQLPVRFDIDRDALETRYTAMQKTIHPDRFAGASLTQAKAQTMAALVNRAYLALKNPLLRAEHMLALAGMAEDVDHQTAHDPAFLGEQMMLREACEEATGHDEREALKRQLTERFESLGARFAQLYEAPAKDIEALKSVTMQMHFFDKLVKSLENA